MPHWRTMMEKEHLGAWDLVGQDGKTPRDYTLKIAGVKSAKLKTRGDSEGKRKCVITFERAHKKMVCNTTNAEVIESLYGWDTDGWVGKLVTLYQADVRSPKGRGTVKGICVRNKRPAGQPEEIIDRPVDQAMRNEQNEAFDRPQDGRQPGDD